jgi:hypothetical protein
MTPSRPFENGHDVRELDVLEGVGLRASLDSRIEGAEDVGIDLYQWAGRQNYSALEDVFQLTDVSRPGVAKNRSLVQQAAAG